MTCKVVSSNKCFLNPWELSKIWYLQSCYWYNKCPFSKTWHAFFTICSRTILSNKRFARKNCVVEIIARIRQNRQRFKRVPSIWTLACTKKCKNLVRSKTAQSLECLKHSKIFISNRSTFLKEFKMFSDSRYANAWYRQMTVMTIQDIKWLTKMRNSNKILIFNTLIQRLLGKTYRLSLILGLSLLIELGRSK